MDVVLKNMQITIDPEFESCLRPLTEHERLRLEESIAQHGVLMPILIWKITADEAVIIDGHNRFKIGKKMGYTSLPLKYIEFESKDSAIEWIIRDQMGKRNLTSEQQHWYIHKYYCRIRGRRGGVRRQGQKAGRAISQTALALGVTDGLVVSAIRYGKAVEAIENLLGEGVRDKILNDAWSIKKNEIVQISRYPIEVLRNIIKYLDEGLSFKLARAKASKAEYLDSFERQAVDLESVGKDFRIIVADPPWKYRYAWGNNRAVERHYPTMDLADICNMGVPALTAKDCILFLWSPANHIDEAMVVLSSWGFRFLSSMVWRKDNAVPGAISNVNHELVLIGVRGEPYFPNQSEKIDSVFTGPNTAHSRKPPVLEEWISKVWKPFPKLELFSRQRREGWVCWGNEIPAEETAEVDPTKGEIAASTLDVIELLDMQTGKILKTRQYR